MKKDINNSHKLPEGYFEQFNQRLMDKIAAEEASSVVIIPKNDGFSIPEGYLDTVYAKTAKAAGLEKTTKVIPLYAAKKWLAVAASLALLITLYLTVKPTTGEGQLSFDALAATEIQDYLQANTEDLTTYELASLLPTETLSNTLFIEETLESDVILDYLDENVDELEDLNLDYEIFE